MGSGTLAVKQKPKISRKTANELGLKSFVKGPIEQLSLMRQSLLFAEISLVSYLPPNEIGNAAAILGFESGRYFSSDGSQAYWLSNEHDSVIVCRGTEPDEWNDIKADLSAVMALAETVGHVHMGFKKEVDDLWPGIEKALIANDKRLWFTGHSLGGAMATICAGRCQLSHIKSEPSAVFTFGAPRTGNRRYVNHANIVQYRWVNNNDVIPTLPPMWLGFRHVGDELYIDGAGNVRSVTGWRRFSDRLRAFVKGIVRLRVDMLSDHLMPYYIDSIDRAIQAEDAKTALSMNRI